MKRIFIPISLLLLLVLAATCSSSTEPGNNNGNQPDTTSHILNWKIDTIGIAPSYLNDVWGTSDNNIYAVGFVYFSFSPYKASNIVHWDGYKWSAIDYLQGDLNTIYGFGDNDIWAAGLWQVDYNLYTLIAHWDGESWNTWKFQEYPQISALWGTSSKNIYAVGANGTILHFDGKTWQKIESGTNLYLTNIFGFANGNFFVGGGSIETDTGILLKYDGTSIKKIIERNYIKDTLSGIITGICGKDENNLIVESDAGTYQYKDNHWINLNLPDDNTLIRNIRGNYLNNLFTIGSFGMIIHYNGQTWHLYNEFYRKPNGDELKNARVMGRKVFIVGSSEDSKAIIYRGIQ